MPASDLSSSLQLSLFVCACFVGFSGHVSWGGSWTLQSFVLLPPCALVGNSTKCCSTCLGVSHVWYGLSFTIPSIVAIGGSLICGYVIDVFGLPTAAVSFGLVCFLGNAARALSTYFIFNYSTLISLYILGQVLVETSYAGLCACQEYIGIRYFDPSKQPLVIGVSCGFTYTGNILAALVLPPVAGKLGVPAAYWSLTGLSGVSIVFGIVVAVMFYFSTQMRKLEQELRDDDVNRQRESCVNFARSVRTFKPQFGFILVVYSVFDGCGRTFVSNVPLLETSLSKVSPVQAGRNMTWGYLTYVIGACAMGILLSVTGVQLIIIVFVIVLSAVSHSLMFFNPLIGLIIQQFTMSCTYASIKSVYGFYAPKQSLGLAANIMFANSYISFAAFSYIVGFIFQHHSRWDGAHITLYLTISTLMFCALLLFVLKCRYGDPHPTKPSGCLQCQCLESEDDETRQILDKRRPSTEETKQE